MNKAQEIQNQIYREMSPDKKMQILDDFFEFSKSINPKGAKLKLYDNQQIYNQTEWEKVAK